MLNDNINRKSILNKAKELSSNPFAVPLIISEIEKEPAINEWISIKEKLPEKGERVLFRVEGFVGEGYLNVNDRWMRNDIDVEILFEMTVTHWMPMPKEPKINID